MRNYLLCIVMVLSSSAWGVGEPPKITPVPKPTPAKIENLEGCVVNKLFEMSAVPASRWHLQQNDNIELRVYNNGKTGVVVANVPGTYSILVIGPDGSLSEYRIVVTGDVPNPPTPPSDQLKEQLQKAWNSEDGTAAEKKEQAKDLAELYRQAAILVTKSEIKTSGDLLKRCQDASTVLIGKDKMLSIRKIVGQQLSTILPVDAPLTDNQRKAVADLFKKLNVILDTIGG